ncbi:hypothetical protein SAMN05192543_11349 [Paraburkholderia megapolitana]|uniref:Uncharacterized protein n=1 Tax=Paraburkholderia megapolitana TaxID=420953 RepID=A0A1I3V7R4_9BURK|nr:hypothetical protein SAMN05192543_11349 [Paraburkholderia megapolitana]
MTRLNEVLQLQRANRTGLEEQLKSGAVIVTPDAVRPLAASAAIGRAV